MEFLAIVLALAFGFVLGLVVGARRAVNLMLSGRAVRTTSARLAGFMPPTVPTRSAEDIIAGRIPVMLGGTTHVLQTLPRGAARRWLEQLDQRFAALAVQLDAADTPEIVAMLTGETDAMLDMLLSYDQGHVLPSRDEIDETATDAQILHAVLEVWRAVHPLVDSMVATLDDEPNGTSSGPSRVLPRATDGVPTTSSSS